MDYGDFFRQWNKIFNSPAFTAMNDIQKNAQKLSEIVNSPAFKLFNEQRTLWDSALSFNKALKAADMASYSIQALNKTPFTQTQLSEIQKIIEPSKTFFSAISKNNVFNTAFNNSGVFTAISELSKNMSALTAINKLNNLTSLLAIPDYAVGFSKNNDILIDDEELSENDIVELAQEFVDFPPDNANAHIIPEKLKSKKGNFFLIILRLLLFYLFFDPLVDDFFATVRDKTGITTILERIDIKGWVEELWPSGTGETLIDNQAQSEQENEE